MRHVSNGTVSRSRVRRWRCIGGTGVLCELCAVGDGG